MLDKFKSLKGSTKALIIVCGVMAVVAIGLIIAVWPQVASPIQSVKQGGHT